MPSTHLSESIISDVLRLIDVGWNNNIIAGVESRRFHVDLRAKCIENIRTGKHCGKKCPAFCQRRGESGPQAANVEK